MKSGKQRKKEIVAKRHEKEIRKAALERRELGTAICNAENLAPYNSYGAPAFVERGHYVDKPFQCRDCGVEEVWRATQQKWWYEVAKGNVETTAIRCRACRRKERQRIAEARRISKEGMEKMRKSRA